MRSGARRATAALAAAAVLLAAPGLARGAAVRAAVDFAGTWSGAKLRCQKEESKLVRCGTPSPFRITFDAAGTGSTQDDGLPNRFTWAPASPDEITLVPEGGGETIRLFAVELDETMLTFQAYVYLPTADPDAPAETRYIHYIFDVNLEE